MKTSEIAFTTVIIAAAIILTAILSTASLRAQAEPEAEARKQTGAVAQGQVEQVARGKYLVDIMGCHDSHTPMTMGPNVSVVEGGTPAPVAPRLLSETGLYSDAARLKVDPRNRNFSPQYPPWSDGATKQRWIQLPAGSQIDTRDLGKWDFPIGTRFWKEFSFKGRRVETRFLWRTSKDNWVFASYAWNEAQTDAELASETGIANMAEIADGLRHSVSAISECRACHELEANRDSRLRCACGSS